MSQGRGRLLAVLVPGAALAAWLCLGLLFLWTIVDEPQRAVLRPLASTHGALLFGWWLAAAALAGWVAARLHARYAAAPARLADATRLLAADPATVSLPLQETEPARGLAEAINRLADARRTLAAGMARQVEEASRKVAHERDQLATLMAELEQSVVVCNPEGRILLYNARARALFRALSPTPSSADGAELIGLGRSIHAVIDPALVAHARAGVAQRVGHGASPSARFVTTSPSGHLLHVTLAPVAADVPTASGFVLLLDDITESHAAGTRQDQRLAELTEASRASLASLQAALDMLDYPDLEAADRERFGAVIRSEVAAMSARLAALAADSAQDLPTRWPLQEILAADLAAAARQRVAATGREVRLGEVGADLWLRVDSFALTEAIALLAARLFEARGDVALELRVLPADAWAHLDLVWPDDDRSDAPLAGWQKDTLPAAGGGLSIRDLAQRQGGAVWLGRGGGLAFFRFLLPVAGAEAAGGRPPERPADYDFDLFAASDLAGALDDRLLDALAFTVFDTETTGLDPAGGDEIVQIGAVRVLNGRLLRAERFDQLVDPGRSIPEASTAIHGIRPDMVRGCPKIGEALRALHAFAADTVLVGHNVAFDLRFLKLKEDATGVRFDQPVLDTLLLASVVQPGDAHSMEAIASRLGVDISDRHSALGDALATAAIFVRLLPALRQRDIVTLGQARRASADSLYANLRY